MNIPITKPYFDEREEIAVSDVIKSGWVTQGPKVKEFENLLNEYTGAKYSVAVTSCTVALYLSLYINEIGYGDEVIVPSLSFIATANVVKHVGAVPVFVDIDSKTYNIDPSKIEEKITKRTKAILLVHQVGIPAPIDEINAIADKNGLIVIEDGACAIGAVYKKKRIGNSRNLVCFSFHPRKVITTGEGGAITSNNEKFEELLRKLRHQGMSVSDTERHASKEIIFEKYPVVGFNYRMSDINAAVGIVQMMKLENIMKMRLKLAARYNEAFREHPAISILNLPEYVEPTYQTYIIRLEEKSRISRDELMKILLEKGISTRKGIMAIHREKPYSGLVENHSLPETEKAADNTITLPLYPQMTEDEQEYVIESVIEIVKSNVH